MKYEQLTGETIKESFEEFNKENPQVYDLFLKYAFMLLGKNKKISSKLIINRIRWESYIETNAKPYRINDAFTAHYARLFVKDYPEYSENIEMRRIRSE